MVVVVAAAVVAVAVALAVAPAVVGVQLQLPATPDRIRQSLKVRPWQSQSSLRVYHGMDAIVRLPC